MAFLEISNLQKHFGSQTAVHDFSIAIERGEFITFLGPSGCGKTTILRMLAGFEAPSVGSIVFDGREVTHVPTSQRNVGMVFQSYALFPNMTVAENIGFGLKVAHASRDETDARVREMLKLIKLDALAERYPWQMSGGQQQRVALARALANKRPPSRQSTSKIPAAPMPPPMHMVTQTRLAPRRLPSIRAWPVRRWPLTP